MEATKRPDDEHDEGVITNPYTATLRLVPLGDRPLGHNVTDVAKAQINLGFAYATSGWEAEDLAEAAKRYRKAAKCYRKAADALRELAIAEARTSA